MSDVPDIRNHIEGDFNAPRDAFRISVKNP